MTLLVRDEVDVIDAHLAFHMEAGVDLVIAMDHRSRDGTTDVLKEYEHDGHVVCIRQEADEVRQSEWVTGMARLAASDYGADWVINSDADEFFWPQARSLKEVLAFVPGSYGVVYAPMCHFVPRHAVGPFYDVMTVRLSETAPINNPLSRHRPSLKAVHRGSPDVLVHRGNHEVERAGRRLTTWHPLEVLHYPDRSPEQFARKYAHTVDAWPGEGREPGAFVLAAHAAVGSRGAEQAFQERALTDAGVAEALAAETVVIDPRLRDVLRRLRSSAGGFRRPPVREHGGLPPPTTAGRVHHAIDAGALLEADRIRLHRDVDDLEARVRALESRTSHRR